MVTKQQSLFKEVEKQTTQEVENAHVNEEKQEFKQTEIGEMVESWKLVRLGDYFDFTKKPRQLNINDFETLPFIPMDKIPLYSETPPSYEFRETKAFSSGTYFEKDDLLLAKITPSFENGKQGIASNLPLPFGYATTEVIPIRGIKDKTTTEYLAFFLLRNSVRAELAGKMEGSTGRQRLKETTLKEYSIPLPSLDKQKRIAEVLTTIQNNKQALKKELELEQERKAALMEKLFREGLNNEPLKQTEIGEIPESWQVVKLGNIADITSGGTPSRDNQKYWLNGHIPWVKTGEINYTTILDTEEKITEEGLKNSAAKIISKGTILMAMYGQGVTRGKVGILGIDATLNQACAAILLKNPQAVNRLYLFFWLSKNYESIRNLAHGANQKNLNSALIKSIEIPLPLIDEQKQIAEVLIACDEKIQTLKKEINLIDELFQSMLNDLMSGRVRV